MSTTACGDLDGLSAASEQRLTVCTKCLKYMLNSGCMLPQVWDLNAESENAGRFVRTLKGHTLAVTSLLVEHGMLLSGSDDGTVKLWDAESGAFIRFVF